MPAKNVDESVNVVDFRRHSVQKGHTNNGRRSKQNNLESVTEVTKYSQCLF